MKINIHGAVHNLRNSEHFLDVMRVVYQYCEFDRIHTNSSSWTQEEFNGKRSVWAAIRTTFGLTAQQLQDIEHYKLTNKDGEQ